MSKQVVQLKRSDKCFLAGLSAIGRKLNEEAKEFNWFDKNIALIREGKYRALKKLIIMDR